MSSRKVKWHNKTRNLIQDSSEGLEYAFLNKNYEQIHQLVWCKDFLNDVIYGFLNNKRTTIWGFSYDPNKHLAPYLGSTRILLTSKRDKEFPKKIQQSLNFVNEIEEHLKMSKTQMEICHEPPRHYRRSGVYIFNGSKRWQKAPPMLSLYTLLIRVGLNHTFGTPWQETIEDIRNETKTPYYEEDATILRNGKIGMDRIFKFGDRKLFHRDIRDNYSESVDIDVIHNDCGIVGYSNNSTSYCYPHWHRLER